MAGLGRARAGAGPESFEVAVLTHSGRRLENLCRVARDEVETARWGAYLCATFEVVEAEDFAAYGWPTLDGEDVALLPEEVWPEEPARRWGVSRCGSREPGRGYPSSSAGTICRSGWRGRCAATVC